MANTSIIRNSRFHAQVEQDVRNALGEFGIPPHLVEFERDNNLGRRAAFQVYIDGMEVFDEPKMIEFIQTAIVTGLEIAKACINKAKTIDYDKFNAANEDVFREEVEEVEAKPEPARPRSNPTPVSASIVHPASIPVPENTSMRRAAARDGTKPIRKRFGAGFGNVTPTRKGYQRPSFIARMVD